MGDIYPVTGLGKLLSSVIAVLGIGFVALPTSMLSAGFIEELTVKKGDAASEGREERNFCPYCGKKLD